MKLGILALLLVSLSTFAHMEDTARVFVTATGETLVQVTLASGEAIEMSCSSGSTSEVSQQVECRTADRALRITGSFFFDRTLKTWTSGQFFVMKADDFSSSGILMSFFCTSNESDRAIPADCQKCDLNPTTHSCL